MIAFMKRVAPVKMAGGGIAGRAMLIDSLRARALIVTDGDGLLNQARLHL